MIDLYYNFNSYIDYLQDVKFVKNKFNEWCRENCSQYFIIETLGKNIRCSFIDRVDAMGFKLRWL